MASRKFLVAAAEEASSLTISAPEAASFLARFLRAHVRSIGSRDLVQFPLVDGDPGTIDFLVSHTLGSFLEVETRDARGENAVVPIGFAGEDGKLAVIEMDRVSGVSQFGDAGTTVGIGELIQDALDEGAFSIILGEGGPIARDFGMGAASALGVRFFDSKDRELDFSRPGTNPADIARIDVSQRSFALLSSRIFIARSHRMSDHAAGHDKNESRAMAHLTKILRRDVGIVPKESQHASAIEFGLSALLGAEIREGAALVLEASGIAEAISRGEFTDFIFLGPSPEPLDSLGLTTLAQKHIPRCAMIMTGEKMKEKKTKVSLVDDRSSTFHLSDVELFQAPLTERSSLEERRRDFSMRLEKIVPKVIASFDKEASTLEKTSAHA